jgi:hypothetical protein
MSSSSDEQKIMLSDPRSYLEWITSLQTRANVVHVWHLFDPMGADAPMADPLPPVQPTLSQFVAEGAPEPTGAHELSAANNKIWTSQLDYHRLRQETFKINSQRYTTQCRAIETIVKYIQSTITSHLFTTCCLPNQNFHQWINNIANTVGVDPVEAQQRARDEYNWILREERPRKTTRWDAWLRKYNEAATVAEKHGCIELTDNNLIRVEFMNAVQGVDPLWTESIRQQAKVRHLNRQDVMADWRAFMERHHPLKPTHKNTFVNTRGDSEVLYEGDAFLARIGPSEVPAAGPGNNGKGLKPKTDRGKNLKRSAPAEGNCLICGNRSHLSSDCYYLEGNKPDWFTLNEQTQQRVKSLLESHPGLEDVARSAKRPRRGTEPRNTRSKSKSSTPRYPIKHSQTPDLEAQDN